MRAIFFGPIGLRSGWRIALWIFASGMMSALIFAGAVWYFDLDPRRINEAPEGVQMLVTALAFFPDLLLTWLFVRGLDHAGFASVGLGGPSLVAMRELLVGTLSGAAILAAAFAVDAIGGGATLAPGHPSAPLFAAFLAGLLLAAAREELAFRGAPFQGSVRGIGPVGATALFAAFFGAGHLGNGGMTLLAFASIVGAGVLLAVAYFARRNLWFPIGLHFGWNAMQGMVLGVPVSGNAGFPSLFVAKMEGPDWRTGGRFGTEGSIGSLVAIACGIALLLWRMRSAPREVSAVAADRPIDRPE